ncbi:hypothetical protein HK097_010431 [Rhizophlyctis rosea]|uniref:Tyrosinase copper-binding domain-containing protein n=1 Tax=Rhizophlyctis rosea TaxID=64517 RepID=A0AAD5SAV4_9FUNG|nr:hypothetical protein HK097_010431 [Rhizophlyctis rosea]
MTTDDWARWYKVIRAAALDTTNVLNKTALALKNHPNDIDYRLNNYENDLHRVGGKMSVWDQIGWLHRAYSVPIHGNRIFLIWHRHFIRWVEKLLQKYDSKFTWFYWATHLMPDPAIWQTDPIWEHLGQSSANKDISGSQFPLANITLRGNVMDPLRGLFRAYTLSDANYRKDGNSKWATLDHYNYVYAQSVNSKLKGFHTFASLSEDYHALVHVSQGGVMAGMASPLDPVFFAHHGNVDFLYNTTQYAWNTKDASKMTQAYQIRGNCPANDDPDAVCLTLNTKLPYFEIPVKDVQFNAQQCVKYAPYVKGPWIGKASTTTATAKATTAPTPSSIWVRPTFPSRTRIVGNNKLCGTSNAGAVCGANLCCAFPLATDKFYCGATEKYCGAGRCNPLFGSCWANATTVATTTTAAGSTSAVAATVTTAASSARTTAKTSTTVARAATTTTSRAASATSASTILTWIRPAFASTIKTVSSNQKCGSSNGGAVCAKNLCCAYPLKTKDFYCGNTANHCGPGRCNLSFGSCWTNSTSSSSKKRRDLVDVGLVGNVGEESVSSGVSVLPTTTVTTSDVEATTTQPTATEVNALATPITLSSVTYHALTAPLDPPPEWWYKMNYRNPKVNTQRLRAAFVERSVEVANAVKNKVVIPAPVEYMENDYTGVLPAVPLAAVVDLLPELRILYGGEGGRKRKCRAKGEVVYKRGVCASCL